MKTNYDFKKYEAVVDNGNEEQFGFYLMARGVDQARDYVEAYILKYWDRYHIGSPNYRIRIMEVSDHRYGYEYGYPILN